MNKFCFSAHRFPERPHPPASRAVYRSHPWSRDSIIHGVLLLTFAIGLAASGAISASSWETSTMRAPGGGLIRAGMSRQEVLKELGQPLGARASARNTASGGKSAKQNKVWTYRGNDGLYAITFSGEKVVKIEVTPDRD